MGLDAREACFGPSVVATVYAHFLLVLRPMHRVLRCYAMASRAWYGMVWWYGMCCTISTIPHLEIKYKQTTTKKKHTHNEISPLKCYSKREIALTTRTHLR